MPSQSMPELMAQVDRIERQVARISANLGIPYDYPVTSETPPEVVELAQSGKKIAAVKRYRELTGAGLQEAKEAVDAL
jgi:ribosomal protein L7/L12